MPRARNPASPALPPAHDAWLSVVKAYHLCDQVLTQRLAALGLKLSEHEVLVNLLLHPGATQQQLAAHSFTAKSVMSALVGKLEQAGWLRREPDASDARAWRLHLTDAGDALARRALAVQAEVVQRMTAASSPAELRDLQRQMDAGSTALRAMLQSGGA
jgi:DNA-binding MarR family transcriptional regulator